MAEERERGCLCLCQHLFVLSCVLTTFCEQCFRKFPVPFFIKRFVSGHRNPLWGLRNWNDPVTDVVTFLTILDRRTSL